MMIEVSLQAGVNRHNWSVWPSLILIDAPYWSLEFGWLCFYVAILSGDRHRS